MKDIDDRADSSRRAPRVFISYRRTESSGQAGRLYDRLIERLGTENVFMDVDSIWAGADFVNAVEDAIWKCDALVALIGPSWLTVTDGSGQRRLDNPDDLVRVEIEAALRRGIRVVPVLVEGAQMPGAAELPSAVGELARRHALELDHSRFDADVESLVRVLERAREERRRDEWDGVPPKGQGQLPSDPTPAPDTSIRAAQGTAPNPTISSRAVSRQADEPRDVGDVASPPGALSSTTESGRQPRWRWMALAGLIGFLLGGGTVSAYFLVFREQPSDIYERLVLEHLTSEESCSQTNATSPDPSGNLAADGVLAEALCTPTDEGGIEARFYLIHSTISMQTTFYDILIHNKVQSTHAAAAKLAAIRENAGLSSELSGRIDASCRQQDGVANAWISDPDTGSAAHLEVEPGAATSTGSMAGSSNMSASPTPVEVVPTGGLVACYVSEKGIHTMVWTDNQTTILTIATGPRRADLYNWWAMRAGPANELMHVGGM